MNKYINYFKILQDKLDAVIRNTGNETLIHDALSRKSICYNWISNLESEVFERREVEDKVKKAIVYVEKFLKGVVK